MIWNVTLQGGEKNPLRTYWLKKHFNKKEPAITVCSVASPENFKGNFLPT
jgi:hypothetical protein